VVPWCSFKKKKLLSITGVRGGLTELEHTCHWLGAFHDTLYYIYLIKVTCKPEMPRKWEVSLAKARTFWYLLPTLKTEIWAFKRLSTSKSLLRKYKFLKSGGTPVLQWGCWGPCWHVFKLRFLDIAFVGRYSLQTSHLHVEPGVKDYIPEPNSSQPTVPTGPQRDPVSEGQC
jgi:hypothetical protein